MSKSQLLAFFLLVISNVPLATCIYAEGRLSATLEQDTAWVGQPVQITIVLYSPGPFSGTAAFDLPDMPQTAILREGNPVVGSESLDGETFFTQRHELKIYTQRAGKIEIPSFRVRYAGKESFVGPAIAMEASTERLSFNSVRPPGTAAGTIVVSADSMKVSETWQPNEMSLQAGDVLRRTIARSATGTTAMMLPPIAGSELEGVRTYREAPRVVDVNQRGVASAERTDVLKYQFESEGEYELPEIEISWWDPQAEELRQETLAGISISVRPSEVAASGEAAEDAATSNGQPAPNWWLIGMVGFAIIAIGVWVPWRSMGDAIRQWKDQRIQSEPYVRKQLLRACRSHQPQLAYQLLLTWESKRGMGLEPALVADPKKDDLSVQRHALARSLYGAAMEKE